jgi:F0F1-type ATP synthase assembly protein I
MLHGFLTSKLAGIREALNTAEQENITAKERNRELSRRLLALAEKLEVQSSKDIQQPQLREKINAVEKEAKESRRRMRNLKDILSGMIVGSGIDWAEDQVLRELVMDDEDDD